MQEKRIITSKEIGGRIKNRRIELGISQEKLAEVLDVTYQQVQRYENGTNRLNVENIQLIAHALSVPVLHFFASDLPAQTGKTLMVAEEATPYLPVDETKLLGYFRKIENNGLKNIVVQVARLVVKAKKTGGRETCHDSVQRNIHGRDIPEQGPEIR